MKKTKKYKRDSLACLRAAQKVSKFSDRSSDAFSCIALSLAEASPKLRGKYSKLFKPTKKRGEYYNNFAWMDNDPDLSPGNQCFSDELKSMSARNKWRILALLFMHQITKDKDWDK